MTTRQTLPRALSALAATVLLGACEATRALSPEPALMQTHAAPPPGAAPGSCWGKDVTPAVVETVTERVLLQPAQVLDDGTVVSEPIYKLETRQAIVKERRELWFETPCERQLTPDFIASLQRALAARGFYTGPVTGEMDARTRRAIRSYQAPQGLDSGIVSLAAARKLGLVAVPREDDSSE
ncbi:peptidoglycan-binding domain-containing protein [Rhodalgimonas zhirmunskyi]|uniref:Peptidoglycan-binding protein n=1 Tax=Rhodalgimonas zhirmunskyi TaxID=2964767 RepID=A0AAJ1UAG9_9RHOB|nr:peptidoglycan-binding domain-containing protein [Rhodoalgimonas zhirmunskyi]MDQ2094830.1 peptidoglycan-binding protein [Rhodoalgimonas zhirmunskyi]